MRFFLDTEFDQETDPVQLISIGIVCSNGKEFYAVNTDYKFKPRTWLDENVKPFLSLSVPSSVVNLDQLTCLKGSYLKVKVALEDWLVAQYQSNKLFYNPEWWGYMSAYDWFLLTRFWGFGNGPVPLPYLCLDTEQYRRDIGVTFAEVSKHVSLEPRHNALIDARDVKEQFEALEKYHAQIDYQSREE